LIIQTNAKRLRYRCQTGAADRDKLLLMAAVSNMPDVAWQKMAVGARHRVLTTTRPPTWLFEHFEVPHGIPETF
jgi:hypothetical protein